MTLEVTHQQLGAAVIAMCLLVIVFIVWKSLDKRITRDEEDRWDARYQAEQPGFGQLPRPAWDQHPTNAWPESGLSRYLDRYEAETQYLPQQPVQYAPAPRPLPMARPLPLPRPQPRFTPAAGYPAPASRISGPMPTSPLPVLPADFDVDQEIAAMIARTDAVLVMLASPLSV